MRRLNSVFTAVLLVQGVVAAFAKDDRILAWDVWNEPGSDNLGSYPKEELKDRPARVTALLP